jgi:hypothetical protein
MPGVGLLIEWAVGAVAVLAFVAWGNSVLKHHYTAPLIAEQKAQTQACKSTIDSQQTTITNQGASLADLLRRTGEQNGAIARLGEIAKFQGDAADKLRAEAAQRRGAKQPTIDRDDATAHGAPIGGTCESQLQKVRELGDEYARGVGAK